MNSQVSITSQGQISIPARIREMLGIKTPSNAIVKVEGDRIVIEPVRDFLELKGVFSTKVAKKKSAYLTKTIEKEESAVKEYVLDKFSKKHVR